MILSAGGQDEQPCEVNSSTTARGSAWAGRMTATIAQMPSAPDQREINHKPSSLPYCETRDTSVRRRPRYAAN